MKNSLQRAALGGTAVIALALSLGACSKGNTTTAGGVPASSTAPTVSVPTSEKIDDPKTSTTEKQVTASTTKKATTTTAKANDADFGAAAAAAYKDKLGAGIKALEMKIFLGSNQRATLQAQDPAKPKNVDEYEYKAGTIDDPVPVKLSGSGTLDENLFDFNTVAFDKLPAMMEQAKTSIGEIEGSEGVTHIIVKKNLPFDDDTVVDVYIGGGTRGDGGYVMFKADGTLKKVYGPSQK